MGSLYYDLKGILEGAGLTVVVNDINKGWERRARSSGGFSSPPLCVFWHHTASNTSVNSDLTYMIKNCPDAPVGNLLIARDGVCYPIAGGASNCAGKGRAMSFSRGTGPADNGNAWGFQIEVQCDGVGQAFSQAQVDSWFRASNALNAAVGNLPTDVTSHALGAGDGYTDRKIDPATAAAVEGPWKPRSTNSSGTWSLADIRNECAARAATPDPGPTPPDWRTDMMHVIAEDRGAAIVGPGYWHYARTPNEAYMWQKYLGPPLQLENAYDYDLLMRTMALQPDDDTVLGPTG